MNDIELIPYFQPIVDTAGGVRPIGYEALIRGRAATRMRGAKEVFERADEFGGYKLLDKRIRELEVAAGLPLLSGDQRIFLNLPPQACRDPSWKSLRSATGSLVIEVSEHARLSEEEIAWLADFRHHQIEIAIDDFGVGQTNLQMLSLLRPEYLKLDLSFVRRGDFETVRRMRRFAEDWGTKLVVEGVETVQEADAVLDAGVRYIQGFYYGLPNEARHWLSRIDSGGHQVRSQDGKREPINGSAGGR